MIYLASASPRRKELLHQAGVDFEAWPSNIVEERMVGETPVNYVRRVAADKARFVASLVGKRQLPTHPVLGADTEVVMENEIIGKPRDRTHAASILKRLSGKSHVVLTAVCLVTPVDEYSALSESRVTFAELTESRIERYLASGEADDKAGAYAIQGRAAGFITHLEGSYSGVMGLPLYELGEILRRANVESA